MPKFHVSSKPVPRVPLLQGDDEHVPHRYGEEEQEPRRARGQQGVRHPPPTAVHVDRRPATSHLRIGGRCGQAPTTGSKRAFHSASSASVKLVGIRVVDLIGAWFDRGSQDVEQVCRFDVACLAGRRIVGDPLTDSCDAGEVADVLRQQGGRRGRTGSP